MKYTQLLPFMDREELKKIAEEIISGELKGVRLQSLFPFLGRESLHEIVDKLIEKKDSETLQSAIPFISREKVLDIYHAAEKGELPNFDASRCIPFLGSETIKELFRDLVKNAPAETEVEDED
ncbi:MAG: hypothetical protein RBT45_05255 [Acholeplasmataceae bacterium]|jgi:hypothetical protein|nr:hypothetical protein [Acholeplasmataceae bacterium]